MSKDVKNWAPATKLVHGGTERSQFGETSEALYLTQGYLYPSAEAAEGFDSDGGTIRMGTRSISRGDWATVTTSCGGGFTGTLMMIVPRTTMETM